jgi:hypothetical protein
MASMQDLTEEAIHAAAIEAQEINLVAKLGLHPYPDGNMWCVLWGADLQNGVAGFGKIPELAVWDFNKNYRTRELPSREPGTV